MHELWAVHVGSMTSDLQDSHTGEAQKIERIMEKFAERYCRDNPGQFRTADGAYVLSFALIMLNTDAHNPQADKKLSQSDFINMCQDQVHAELLMGLIVDRHCCSFMKQRSFLPTPQALHCLTEAHLCSCSVVGAA